MLYFGCWFFYKEARFKEIRRRICNKRKQYICSSGFSYYMIDYHLDGTGVFTEDRYCTAMYIRHIEGDCVVYNNGEISSHLNSIAEKIARFGIQRIEGGFSESELMFI